MTKVKICGITDLRDGLKAYELGADFVGFNFSKRSPRKVEQREARVIIEDLPRDLLKVGLFVNQDLDSVKTIARICHIDIIQLHGDEDSRYCDRLSKDFTIIKAFRIKNISNLENVESFTNVDYYLFDTYIGGIPGGTGKSFDWDILRGRSFKKPVFLAGGLTPRNVGEAIKKTSPYAVDVTSGVEKSPGRKDYKLLKEFIDNAKKT